MATRLEKIRQKIDKTDKDIVRLIAIRQSYMPEVGAIKKKQGLPVFQPKREASVLVSKKAMARQFGVSAKLVEKIFALIFKDSRRIQKGS